MTVPGSAVFSQSDYPPSLPSFRTPRLRPPLLVQTNDISSDTSFRDAAHSPARGVSRSQPLYDLPTPLDSPTRGVTGSRARPGGLAGIAAGIGSDKGPPRVKPLPGTPSGPSGNLAGQHQNRQAADAPYWARRGSDETFQAGTVRRRSDQSLLLSVATRRDRSRTDATPSLLQMPSTATTYHSHDGIIHSQRGEGTGSPKAEVRARVQAVLIFSQDLRLFAHHCRLFYFSPFPPQDAAAYISTTLASLTPLHRAAYTRLQSSLRSLAHLHHLRVRITSFHALISSTVSSASLSALSRPEPTGVRAREERKQRLERFIGAWCTTNAGGVEPFFRGLWGAFRAQSRGQVTRGGAGGRRVIWEIDDAVFLESG